MGLSKLVWHYLPYLLCHVLRPCLHLSQSFAFSTFHAALPPDPHVSISASLPARPRLSLFSARNEWRKSGQLRVSNPWPQRALMSLLRLRWRRGVALQRSMRHPADSRHSSRLQTRHFEQWIVSFGYDSLIRTAKESDYWLASMRSFHLKRQTLFLVVCLQSPVILDPRDWVISYLTVS